MKKDVVEFLKKSSLTFFGETKIPEEMIKEFEKKNSRKHE